MNIVRDLSNDYTFDIILFSNKKSFYDEEFLSYGGNIYRFPCKSGRLGSKADYYIRSARLFRQTLKVLKQNGPYDAVHCHNEHESGLCLMAAKKAGINIRIAHTHIISNRPHIIGRVYCNVYRRLIEKYATHRLGCSRQACESFYKVQNGTKEMNNPYDAGKFYFDKHPEVEFDSPKLLQVGSFSHRKNQLFSLEIIAEIKKVYPLVQFNMIGFEINVSSDEINKRALELGILENVKIYSADADSAKLLAESTSMLIPSKSEAFGIVAIEAQAMGVKCYASDALPPSTNCGGCEYLPLSAGAATWAEKIISDFKATGGKHKKYDCSAFASENVANEYRKIYGGNEL